MEEENYFSDISKVLEDLPLDFNILEEQIDIEDQMEYFKSSQKMREMEIDQDMLENSDELFSDETAIERKKEILTSLALIDDVKAYRKLEEYCDQAGPEIRNWAVMAMQESRMILKSSLLDEKQVFISTGLGGKGQKLRYYVVFMNRIADRVLNSTQQKVIRNELTFRLGQEAGELESIDFSNGFSSSLLLLPVKSDIHEVFRNIIEECNQYGDFLEEDLIITNVKVLTGKEITDIIEKKNKDEEDKFELEEE